MRRPLRQSKPARGFTLIVFLSLVVAGVLAFLIATLGPEAMEAWRARKTEAALAEAREALLGYALQHRDRRMAQVPPKFEVYGYLPMPDLGESQNKNALLGLPCSTEGCAKQNNSGTVGINTYIGRLPWKTLGTEPLRDGYGECLWYIVSAGHKDVENSATMNWDSLGQMDVVAADGIDTVKSTLATAHDRPIAIVFSPGPRIGNQNRNDLGTDDVAECRGNYNPANYLDPAVVSTYLNSDNSDATAETKYFDGSASADTSTERLAVAIANRCPTGSTCTLDSNDRGLAIAPDTLFSAIRKNGNFRFHINSMLDRMTECLQDFMVAGTYLPQGINGYTSAADKSGGRLMDLTCYNSVPPGYFTHWQEMFFAAKTSGTCTTSNTTGCFSVTVDGVTQACNGVLIFSGQRGIKSPVPTDPDESPVQLRNLDQVSGTNSRLNANWLGNYLEDTNLTSFMGTGTGFSGSELLLSIGANKQDSDDELRCTDNHTVPWKITPECHTAEQDVVRCIPNTASLLTVNSQDLLDDGFGPMASYDPGTRTLTLGSEDAETDKGATGSTLYGCAWTVAANTRGNGFRSYFTMRFMGITGGVGNNGFVFAAIDGENNTTSVCGAAGSHLGYSGNNGVTPPLTLPKIGIEFDQGRDTGTVSTALSSGRNDPCGTSSCGGTVGYNSHSAIVYWGDRALNYDDNVHGAGTPLPDPRNPNVLTATPPGIAFVNYRANEDIDGDGQDDSYLYHVRVEVTPVAATNTLPSVRVAAAGNVTISSPGSAIDGVTLSSGDRVLLAAQSSAASNGIYVWTADDAPLTRAADADTGGEVTDAEVTVTEGHHAGNWRQTSTITTIGTSAQSWQPAVRQFRTQAWIVRDSDTTSVIRAAMQDTTTAMAISYPGYTPKLSDTAIMFANAGAACSTSADCTSGQTCGLDNVCYRPALKSVRLGFTNSQRTQDQKVIISNFFASWPL